MSQKVVDILRGISQAAAGMYDGATDEDGEPVKIGLKREEGNPMLDKRVIDGCKVRCSGKTLIVSYHSELLLKDVYANKKGKLEEIQIMKKDERGGFDKNLFLIDTTESK